MARHIGKNIVGNHLATKCELQLSYAIGLVEPVSVLVETFGISKITQDELEKLVRKSFPLTPHGIVDYLKLRQPIYVKIAAYGHFGHPELNLSCGKIINLSV